MAIASANLSPYIAMGFNAPELVQMRTISCTTGPFTNAIQKMFTITGGPIYGRVIGMVTTDVGATAMNGTLQITTVAPASTTVLSTTVSCASKAAGTSIRFIGATGVLTPVTAGAVMIDPVLTGDCWFLMPIGAVQFLTTAINTGLIVWSMTYTPLVPDAVVVLT